MQAREKHIHVDIVNKSSQSNNIEIPERRKQQIRIFIVCVQMSQHSVAELVDHPLYCLRLILGGLWVPVLEQVISDIDGDDGVGFAILCDSLGGLLAPVEGQIDDGGVTITVRETIRG